MPENIGGNNLGLTSLELTSMGLGGCITTIFMMLANKMKLTMKNCPVSILFEDANIPIEYDLITL